MDGCPFCATSEDLPFSLAGIVYGNDLVCAHHDYQEGNLATWAISCSGGSATFPAWRS